jgi:ribosomal protein S15P/S13E
MEPSRVLIGHSTPTGLVASAEASTIDAAVRFRSASWGADGDSAGQVAWLQRQLSFFQRENEEKTRELEHITQTGRTLMAKLQTLTEHLNQRDKEDERERFLLVCPSNLTCVSIARERVGKEMALLMDALSAAEAELGRKDHELQCLTTRLRGV